jgi:hypothetical protein
MAQQGFHCNAGPVLSVILSLGIVPTTLMILWVGFLLSRWLPEEDMEKHAENHSIR